MLRAIAFTTLVCSACSQHAIVDTMMTSAYRPAPEVLAFSSSPLADRMLSGDMHCHVSPPDADWDVSRDLADTIALAREEGLDFVVLTPHVPARFFTDVRALTYVVLTQRWLRAAIARTDTRGVVLIPGFEYTDHALGHVGMAFADLEEVLGDLDLATLPEHPEAFVDAWIAHGGTLTINHPLVTPIDAPISIARADLSWRPWTASIATPEITRIDALATGWEAYNLTASHLRDRWLLHDRDASVAATFRRLDREIVRRHRRMTPVGGTDSHSDHLRATTFVRADERSVDGIRAALLRGRVCVRSPEACDFAIRTPGGTWAHVGDALEGVHELEIRAPDDAHVFLAGREIAGVHVHVRSDRCLPIRATTEDSWSAPIYVNCGL